MITSSRLVSALALISSLFALAWFASTASASGSAPHFTIESFAAPTDFQPGKNDHYEITVRNVGAADTKGKITIADTLPSGVEANRIQFFLTRVGETGSSDLSANFCEVTTVECHFPSVAVHPDETLRMIVHVNLEPGVSGPLENRATVVGGGSAEASVSEQNGVSSSLAPFGFTNSSFYIAEPGGLQDTQAGDHPYELTTSIEIANGYRQNPNTTTMVQDVKDIVADLPPGFVGSTLATPECTLVQMSGGTCPDDTVIGHIKTFPPEFHEAIDSPIYNLTPERGVPAEFGYIDGIHGTHVFYVHVIPTPEGYVLQTINTDIPTIPLDHIVVTFYGDPVAKQEELARREGKTVSGLEQIPYFTMPSDCSGRPLVTTLYMDSWQNPGRLLPDGTPDFSDLKWVSSRAESPPVSGCAALQFPAEIKAAPTTHEADAPSGMDFEIKVPQSESVGVPATATMKSAVVTLPSGFTVDPSAGGGLGACSETQIGWEEGAPGPMKFNADPPACPEASKIGSLELSSPLIPHELKGEMFLASQNENPFHSTLAAYVVVNDPITGVLIKIAGKFVTDPATGRVTAEFAENPSLPFGDLKLHFFGGPRAELATPESCGTYAVNSELTPWSFPESGPSPADPFDEFAIDEACPNGAFAPAFSAGSLNLQAGAYTPFVASFERSDRDQELAGLTVTLPPGLLANLSGVALCSDAQVQEAREGAQGCPQESQIGTVLAGAGPGPDPLFVSGKAYLTGPYNGGPYGLAVVVPAIAGPFDFGTVVVRQSIRIDPTTARVTDVSDPFPTIIDGIPLRLRRVDVRLDRPGFMFNPTNCSKAGFAGTVFGSPLGAPRSLSGSVGYATESGAAAPVAAPFQVTNCATLGFKPHFTASTAGRTSRADGASLTVKLSYPSAPFGSQANLARVRVELPRQLPSNLKTLQQACTLATFQRNPATCPAGSRVGMAIAHTPILGVPLSGPAYFVSHGGAGFPELVIVLSGGGITVQLHGETFIDEHTNITSSTFPALPDVPVKSFELTLPQGPHSALDANADLCTQRLLMPTTFAAQNGAQLRQSTPIQVTGCKPQIRVRRRVVGRNGTAVLTVTVPSAGTLRARATDVLPVTVRTRKAGAVTLKLSLSRSERRFLAAHPGRRLNAHIRLLFSPVRGDVLKATTTLLIG